MKTIYWIKERIRRLFTKDCGHGCQYVHPYGFVPEADCPVHDPPKEGSPTAEVVAWAQCLLTALNVGDVQSGSKLHLKLREVMIVYRKSKE